MIYTIFTATEVDTDAVHRFHKLAKLAKRLGGDGYMIEHDDLHRPTVRTVAVVRHDPQCGGYHVVTRLRVDQDVLEQLTGEEHDA